MNLNDQSKNSLFHLQSQVRQTWKVVRNNIIVKFE